MSELKKFRVSVHDRTDEIADASTVIEADTAINAAAIAAAGLTAETIGQTVVGAMLTPILAHVQEGVAELFDFTVTEEI